MINYNPKLHVIRNYGFFIVPENHWRHWCCILLFCIRTNISQSKYHTIFSWSWNLENVSSISCYRDKQKFLPFFPLIFSPLALFTEIWNHEDLEIMLKIMILIWLSIGLIDSNWFAYQELLHESDSTFCKLFHFVWNSIILSTVELYNSKWFNV